MGLHGHTGQAHYAVGDFIGVVAHVAGGSGVLMAILCLACTLLPFALALKALRQLSAFGAQLAVNLEPVYAIILSIVILGEQRELSSRFYLGVAIILTAIFAYPLLQRNSNITPAPID